MACRLYVAQHPHSTNSGFSCAVFSTWFERRRKKKEYSIIMLCHFHFVQLSIETLKPLIAHTYPVPMAALRSFISTHLSFIHFSIHLLNHRFPQPNTGIYEPIGYLVNQPQNTVEESTTNQAYHIILFLFKRNNKQTGKHAIKKL